MYLLVKCKGHWYCSYLDKYPGYVEIDGRLIKSYLSIGGSYVHEMPDNIGGYVVGTTKMISGDEIIECWKTPKHILISCECIRGHFTKMGRIEKTFEQGKDILDELLK